MARKKSEEDVMRQLWRWHWSTSQIAQALGTTQKRVRRVLVKQLMELAA